MVNAFQYVHPGEDVSLPSAARTAAGQSSAIAVGPGHTVRALVNVTAATAPTSLTVTLETSHDGSTGWVAVGSFADKTDAAQTERKNFSGLGAFIRWSWVLTGTSFTFLVDAKLMGR